MQNKKHKVDPTAQKKNISLQLPVGPNSDSWRTFVWVFRLTFILRMQITCMRSTVSEPCEPGEKTKMKIGVREPPIKEPRIKMA